MKIIFHKKIIQIHFYKFVLKESFKNLLKEMFITYINGE